MRVSTDVQDLTTPVCRSAAAMQTELQGVQQRSQEQLQLESPPQ